MADLQLKPSNYLHSWPYPPLLQLKDKLTELLVLSSFC